MTGDRTASHRAGAKAATREPQSASASVVKALKILECLSADDEGLRLQQLAERAELSASTTHRLLTTLEERRFVVLDPSDERWKIGYAAYAVGASFIRKRGFVGTAAPFMRALRDKTRETVNLGIFDDDEIVLVHQVESREIVRAVMRPGGRVSPSASSLGKAMMACLPHEDVLRIVERRGFARLTPKSLVRKADLLAELEDIRVKGYAIDDEEFGEGVRCVAAPVFDLSGEVICAISLSGSINRVRHDRLDELGESVIEAAIAITGSLGGQVPHWLQPASRQR